MQSCQISHSATSPCTKMPFPSLGIQDKYPFDVVPDFSSELKFEGGTIFASFFFMTFRLNSWPSHRSSARLGAENMNQQGKGLYDLVINWHCPLSRCFWTHTINSWSGCKSRPTPSLPLLWYLELMQQVVVQFQRNCSYILLSIWLPLIKKYLQSNWMFWELQYSDFEFFKTLFSFFLISRFSFAFQLLLHL